MLSALSVAHKARPARYVRGVTLVEVAVSLAVVAILASILAPSFISAIQRQRLAADVSAIQGQLVLAKSESLKSGLPAYISIQSANQCVGSAWTPGCDCSVPATTTGACSIGKADLSNRIAQNTFSSSAAIDPVRGAVSGAGRLTLQTTDGQFIVTGLTPLGRPFSCAPGATSC